MNLKSLLSCMAIAAFAAPAAAQVTPNASRPAALTSFTAAYGGKGDGTTDNASALTAAFAATNSPTLYFPPGAYRLSCGHSWTAASSVSLLGAGAAFTTLTFDPGCRFNTPPFSWDSRPNVKVSNLTIDLNTPAAGPLTSMLEFKAYNGSTSGLVVDHVNIINGASPTLLITVAASGTTYSGVQITNNYLTLAAPAPSQNECIALTTVNGQGEIPRARVAYNTCVNTAIQVDGAYTQVIGNDVSHFQFGNGIFTAFTPGATSTASNHDCIIANNTIHDTEAGVDVNKTAHNGLENNCLNSLVIGNKFHNLGGGGVMNFANGARYVGNVAFDNGKNGSGGAGGWEDQAGFALEDNGSGSTVYNARDVIFIGNIAYDDGPGTQLYGYAEENFHSFCATLLGNSFEGVTLDAVIQAPGAPPTDVGCVSTPSQASSSGDNSPAS